MKLIPAMDLIDGRCVRLYQGQWQQQDYFPYDPIEWAKANEAAGISRLHMIDLDGAFSGNPKNESVLKAVRKAVNLPIQIGGGIRHIEQAKRLIAEGFEVVLGTMLFKDPTACEKLIRLYPSKLTASVDCRNGQVMLEGWTQVSGISNLDFAKQCLYQGLNRLVYTDIGKDGTLSGANLEELSQLMSLQKENPFTLIASGGIGSLEDLSALKQIGVQEVIVGRALLEGAFCLESALEVCNAG